MPYPMFISRINKSTLLVNFSPVTRFRVGFFVCFFRVFSRLFRDFHIRKLWRCSFFRSLICGNHILWQVFWKLVYPMWKIVLNVFFFKWLIKKVSEIQSLNPHFSYPTRSPEHKLKVLCVRILGMQIVPGSRSRSTTDRSRHKRYGDFHVP